MVMQDSYDSSTIHFLNSYQFMVIARLNPPASLTFPGGRSEDEAEKSLPQHSGWTCRPQWVHVGDQEFLQLENMNRPPKTVAAVAVCSLYFVIFRLEMSVCFLIFKYLQIRNSVAEVGPLWKLRGDGGNQQPGLSTAQEGASAVGAVRNTRGVFGRITSGKFGIFLFCDVWFKSM